jgi:hypothetical protein
VVIIRTIGKIGKTLRQWLETPNFGIDSISALAVSCGGVAGLVGIGQRQVKEDLGPPPSCGK